jgi:hypothetical protein
MPDAGGWSASPGDVIVSLVPVALSVIALFCAVLADQLRVRRRAAAALYFDREVGVINLGTGLRASIPPSPDLDRGPRSL